MGNISNTTNDNIFINNARHWYGVEDGELVHFRPFMEAGKPKFSPALWGIHDGKLTWNADILYYVMHPFSLMNYSTGEYRTAGEGTFLYANHAFVYPEGSGLVMVCFHMDASTEDEAWVASEDELDAMAVPLFEKKGSPGTRVCPYKVTGLKKRMFGRWSFKTLPFLGTYGIPIELTDGLLPSVGILHEFLKVQPDYVHDHFLPSLANIFHDMSDMCGSEIPVEDKKGLLSETFRLLSRMKASIGNVSPYAYGFMDVSGAVDAYNRKKEIEDMEAERRDAAARREKEETERKRMQEVRNRKEEYMGKIKSRLELIGYFDSI